MKLPLHHNFEVPLWPWPWSWWTLFLLLRKKKAYGGRGGGVTSASEPLWDQTQTAYLHLVVSHLTFSYEFICKEKSMKAWWGQDKELLWGSDMTKEAGYFAGGIINQRHISSVLWAPTCPGSDLSTHTTFTSSQTYNITCPRFPWKLTRKVNSPLFI